MSFQIQQHRSALPVPIVSAMNSWLSTESWSYRPLVVAWTLNSDGEKFLIHTCRYNRQTTAWCRSTSLEPLTFNNIVFISARSHTNLIDIRNTSATSGATQYRRQITTNVPYPPCNHVFKVGRSILSSTVLLPFYRKKIRQVYPVWCSRLHN